MVGRRKPIILLKAVLATVVLGLFYACNTQPPRIPDKVEVRIYQQPQMDSVLVAAQLNELAYYLRTHNVTDEGYNLIAQYNTLLSRISRLSINSRTSRIIHISAKDRLLPAVMISGGYWKAGHFH